MGITSDIYFETESRYYRNSSGLVERYVEFYRLWDGSVPLGVDSDTAPFITTAPTHTQGNHSRRDLGGDPFKDSALYSYNDKGQISGFKKYSTDVDDIELPETSFHVYV